MEYLKFLVDFVEIQAGQDDLICVVCSFVCFAKEVMMLHCVLSLVFGLGGNVCGCWKLRECALPHFYLPCQQA